MGEYDTKLEAASQNDGSKWKTIIETQRKVIDDVKKTLQKCEKDIKIMDFISRSHLESWLGNVRYAIDRPPFTQEKNSNPLTKERLLSNIRLKLDALKRDLVIDDTQSLNGFYTKLNVGLSVTGFIVACGILHQQPLLHPSLNTTGLIALGAMLFGYLATQLIKHHINVSNQKLETNIKIIADHIADHLAQETQPANSLLEPLNAANNLNQ